MAATGGSSCSGLALGGRLPEGGKAGTFSRAPAGQNGKAGRDCVQEPAVQLNVALGSYDINSRIPLRLIDNGKVAQAEPFVGTFGCDSTHLHALSGTGVTIRSEDGRAPEGPFGDLFPQNCGYGRLVLVCTAQTQIAQVNPSVVAFWSIYEMERLGKRLKLDVLPARERCGPQPG